MGKSTVQRLLDAALTGTLAGALVVLVEVRAWGSQYTYLVFDLLAVVASCGNLSTLFWR